MALFKAPEARQNFENLSDDEKTRLIGYIQSNNATGQDAKHKIATAVENLKKGNRSFF
jgi:hypothetical protein